MHNERAAEKESSSESIKKFESVVMNKLHEVKLELHHLYIFLIPARPQKSPRLILDLSVIVSTYFLIEVLQLQLRVDDIAFTRGNSGLSSLGVSRTASAH